MNVRIVPLLVASSALEYTQGTSRTVNFKYGNHKYLIEKLANTLV